MKVLTVNIGRPRIMVCDGRRYSTAIFKTPVDGPVELTVTGLVGDHQANREVHGGPDKALCVYPSEHFTYWAQELKADIGPGAFGENLTTQGLLEDDVCIGDSYRVGQALLQVTQPRQPCGTLADKHGQPLLPKWVNQRAYTGFYFRVLEIGPIQAGDPLTLIERPNPSANVTWATKTRNATPLDCDQATRLRDLPELSDSWRQHIAKRLDDS